MENIRKHIKGKCDPPSTKVHILPYMAIGNQKCLHQLRKRNHPAQSNSLNLDSIRVNLRIFKYIHQNRTSLATNYSTPSLAKTHARFIYMSKFSLRIEEIKKGTKGN